MDKQEVVSGYFDSEGKLHLVGKFGAEIVLDPGGSTPTPGGGEVYKPTTVTWKRQGANPATNPQHRHPSIGNGELTASYIRHGEKVTLDILLVVGSGTDLGNGPSGKGWYFFPDDAALKPDFTDPLTKPVPGHLAIWVNDNHVDRSGHSKWSKNVGSGIDGILLNLDEAIYPVSESYPRSWPTGTSFRIQIQYRVALS
jgi:hypothetical protein